MVHRALRTRMIRSLGQGFHRVEFGKGWEMLRDTLFLANSLLRKGGQPNAFRTIHRPGFPPYTLFTSTEARASPHRRQADNGSKQLVFLHGLGARDGLVALRGLLELLRADMASASWAVCAGFPDPLLEILVDVEGQDPDNSFVYEGITVSVVQARGAVDGRTKCFPTQARTASTAPSPGGYKPTARERAALGCLSPMHTTPRGQPRPPGVPSSPSPGPPSPVGPGPPGAPDGGAGGQTGLPRRWTRTSTRGSSG